VDTYTEDNRLEFDDDDGPNVEFTGIELEDFQKAAIHQQTFKEDVFIRSPTGSGKTEIGLHILANLNQPTLIIVPNKNIMDEWIPRIAARFDIDEDDIGKLGGGCKPQVEKITVGLKQTVINKSHELADKFGFIICDEAYSYGAKTFNGAVDAFPAKYRLGLSAWEKRKDSMEFLIYDQFGPDIVEITLDDIEGSGRVVPVRAYMVPTTFNCRARSRPALINRMADNDSRNQLIIRLAVKLLRKGEKVVIFAERIEQCRLLRSMLSVNGYQSSVLIGRSNLGTEQLNTIKQKFEDGEISVLITNRVGVEGISISMLSCAISTYPIFKSIDCGAENDMSIALQQAGRIRRKHGGKTVAKYFYLWDREVLPHDKGKMVETFGMDRVRALNDKETQDVKNTPIKWEDPKSLQMIYAFSDKVLAESEFVKRWRS
jgi:superfamily II DNA or RNA helicase